MRKCGEKEKDEAKTCGKFNYCAILATFGCVYSHTYGCACICIYVSIYVYMYMYLYIHMYLHISNIYTCKLIGKLQSSITTAGLQDEMLSIQEKEVETTVGQTTTFKLKLKLKNLKRIVKY